MEWDFPTRVRANTKEAALTEADGMVSDTP